MTPEVFERELLRLGETAGLQLSEEQAELCCQHIALMLEWNRRVNLTRITDPYEICVKHLLDSLLPAQWLPREGQALDVGTGPGFPGVPLKILCPDLTTVLLEANHKKVAFLKMLLSRLRLKGLHALQGKWETFPEKPDPLCRKQYTLITMRAVKLQPEHLTELASRILAPGGVFAWWAGPGENLPTVAVSSLRDASMVFHANFSYALPGASRPRQLFLWKKAPPLAHEMSEK